MPATDCKEARSPPKWSSKGEEEKELETWGGRGGGGEGGGRPGTRDNYSFGGYVRAEKAQALTLPMLYRTNSTFICLGDGERLFLTKPFTLHTTQNCKSQSIWCEGQK